MKKILFILIALTAAAFAQDTVKVTGDRVSLRAAPETNAVLLARVMLGDELVLKDNSNPDWVGVLPPESIDVWVNSEFVSSNTVLPKLLNIRSGPSLSHHTVGEAHQGDVLTVRDEIADWLKIAPTSNTVIWISRNYVEAPAPVVVEPVAVESVEAVVPAPEMQAVVEEPIVQEVLPATPPPVEKKLTLDLSEMQGVEGSYSGVLQPADAMLYKLVDDHFIDVIVCYVSGNAAQMQTFSGMKLKITGKIYRVEGIDFPVIRPVRIKPFATEEK